jgi:predicted small metal-binding protein
MDKQLKKVSCDPACGFMIQSHDDKEIISMVKSHAKTMHQLNTTDDEIKKKMQVVS